MKTFRYTLSLMLALAGLLLVGVSPALAQEQPTITFSATGGDVEPGGQITVPITVQDFENVATTQFTIEWDPTVLSLTGLNVGSSPLEGLTGGNFNATDAALSQGFMTLSWDDPTPDETGGTVAGDGIPEGETLADGTEIFSLTFDAVGGGSTGSSVAFTGNETPIEVTYYDLVNTPPQLANFAGNDATVNVNAAQVNTPPSVTDPGNQTSTEGDNVSLQIEASDSDGDDLSYAASGLPGGLSIDVATGEISGVIASGAAAGSPYTVEITATDDGTPQEQDMESFQWTVDVPPSNDAPIVTNPGDQTSTEGQSISLQINATDPNSDALTYSASGLPAGLSISSGGLISGTIASGAAQASPYSASVIVSDNENQTDVSFAWTVDEAPEPFLSVSPSSVSFGGVTTGSSASETVTITNTGTADLAINSISVAGGSAFSIASGGTAGTLQPSETQDVVVEFAPTSAGAQSATLSVSTNAGSEDVSLGGTGQNPQPAGTVTFNAESASVPTGGQVTIDITVDGFTDVNGAQFTLTWDEGVLDFAGTGNYNLEELNDGKFGFPGTGNIPTNALTFAWNDNPGNGPETVADGTAIFSVTFDAVGAVGQNSAIAFASSPTDQEVSGGGTVFNFASNNGVVDVTAPPAITVSAESVDFGSVEVGNSTTETITVESTGGSDLEITSVGLSGSGDFSIQSGGESGTLVPSATRTIVLAFAPASAGDKSATLTIESNAGTETVALSGTAPQPTTPTPGITVAPAGLLSFGSIEVGSSATQAVTVESTGDADLDITSIDAGSGSFSQTNDCSAALPQGNSCTISVAFAPTMAGAQSATLTIESNAGTETVALSGTGEVAPPPTTDDEVTFILSEETVPAGGQVTVAVSVEGFAEVNAAQFTLSWDPSLLSFVETGGYNETLGITGGFFATPQDGTLTFAYDDIDGGTKTLPNGTTIFTVTFDASSDEASVPVAFANAPTQQKVFVNFAEAQFGAEDGLVEILAQVGIEGAVTYYNGLAVEGAGLTLGGDASASATAASDGSFVFTADAGGSYTLAASKANDAPAARGVNVNDLSLIRRHVLGIAPFGSPYVIIAADADRSASVSVNDISMLRSLVLSVEQTLPGGLWQCPVAGQSFSDPSNPFPYQTERSYANLVESVTGQGFHCFRSGDVDGSWTPAGAAPSALAATSGQGATQAAGQPLRLAVEGEHAGGREVLALVRASDFDNVGGYQFTLEWDQQALEFAGVERLGLKGLSAAHFGTHRVGEGLLTTVWTDPEGRGQTLADDAVLFAVRFRAKNKTASVDVSSAATPMVAHRGDATLSPVRMVTTGGQIGVQPKAFALQGNYPNPFSQSTALSIDLPTSAEVSVTVYDLLGRRVMTRTENMEAGAARTLRIEAASLPAGVYLYRVHARMTDHEAELSGRMTVVK